MGKVEEKGMLPHQYEEQMKGLLGEEYPDYLASLERLPDKGLRVNENKISVSDFLNLWSRMSLPELEQIPWIHNGFFVPKGLDAASLWLYQAGLYYIQEPAAMSPAEFLPVEKHDRVLDLCAAPGGKSTELLSKLGRTGVLYSNDVSPSRAKALKKNLETAGAVNAFVTAETPEKLAAHFPAFFQKILVDAPCSGEGMFRVQPSMMQHWEECGPEYYAPVQREILEQAYRMLAPGGMLMYSTCTFSKKEDEEQILGFLKEHPDLQAVELPLKEGFESLQDSRSGGRLPFVRLYPHKLRGEGQFMALLQKREGKEAKAQNDEMHGRHSQEKAPVYWRREDEVYLLPEGIIPEKNLHYLLTGRHIGTIKNGVLVPSQADAMTESEKTWPDTLNLCFDDPRVFKYLKGETLSLSDAEVILEPKKTKNRKLHNAAQNPKDGTLKKRNQKSRQNNGKGTREAEGVEITSLDQIPKKNQTLVCVEGLPVGFGKRNRNMLKNLRSPGWRMQ